MVTAKLIILNLCDTPIDVRLTIYDKDSDYSMGIQQSRKVAIEVEKLEYWIVIRWKQARQERYGTGVKFVYSEQENIGKWTAEPLPKTSDPNEVKNIKDTDAADAQLAIEEIEDGGSILTAVLRRT